MKRMLLFLLICGGICSISFSATKNLWFFNTGDSTTRGLGFAPMVADGVVYTGPYAEDIGSCVLALYAENYSFNTGATATWVDVSGAGMDVYQGTEVRKPTVETYNGKTTVRFQVDRNGGLVRTAFSAHTSNKEFSAVVCWANRAETTSHCYPFNVGEVGDGSERKRLGIEFGPNAGSSYDKFDWFGGWNKDNTYSGTNIASKDQDLNIVAYSTDGDSAAADIATSTPITGTLTDSFRGANFSFSNDPLCIGYNPGYQGSNCNIFSIHMWNRALTSSELAEAVSRVQAALTRGYR